MLGSRKEAEATECQTELYLSPGVDRFKAWDWYCSQEINKTDDRQCYDQLAEWSEKHPEFLHRDQATPGIAP